MQEPDEKPNPEIKADRVAQEDFVVNPEPHETRQLAELTEPELKALRAELVRLRIKRSESTDTDIIAALDARIQVLERQVPAKKDPDDEPLPEPPTPAQLAEADKLVRQARVESMRGNKRGATDLLRQASEVAPGAPSLLEAFGDDLMERGLLPQAKVAYKRAWKMDPSSVSLERKFAIAVTRMDAAGSIDDQMRLHLSDSPFLTSGESLAGASAAIWISMFMPGLGHIVLGKTTTGISILVTWVVLSVWAGLKFGNIAKVLARPTSTSPAALVPLVLLLILYIGTVMSLQQPKRRAVGGRPEHPKPPVDMPF